VLAAQIVAADAVPCSFLTELATFHAAATLSIGG
jgi:hypothetical protein